MSNTVSLNWLDKLVLRLLCWRGRVFLRRLKPLFEQRGINMQIKCTTKGFDFGMTVAANAFSTESSSSVKNQKEGAELPEVTTKVERKALTPVQVFSLDIHAKSEEDEIITTFDKEDYARLCEQVEKVEELGFAFITNFFGKGLDIAKEIGLMGIQAKSQGDAMRHEQFQTEHELKLRKFDEQREENHKEHLKRMDVMDAQIKSYNQPAAS